MPQYLHKDKFYFKAKEEGYRSRAAYKLIEIHKKFDLLNHKKAIIDLGCAPGSWVQVCLKQTSPQTRIAGIDLDAVTPFPNKNVRLIQGSVDESLKMDEVISFLRGKADLVLSDMSPKISGIKYRDQYQCGLIAHLAFEVAKKSLVPGGDFVLKVFPGPEIEELRKQIKQSFTRLKTFEAIATRNTSKENYLIAKGFIPS